MRVSCIQPSTLDGVTFIEQTHAFLHVYERAHLHTRTWYICMCLEVGRRRTERQMHVPTCALKKSCRKHASMLRWTLDKPRYSHACLYACTFVYMFMCLPGARTRASLKSTPPTVTLPPISCIICQRDRTYVLSLVSRKALSQARNSRFASEPGF